MQTELMGKRLELLSELVPRAGVIAHLVNPTNPSAERRMRDVQEAARAKGVTLSTLKAESESDIDAAFSSLAQMQAGALVVTPTRSSPAGARRSWRSRRAMLFRRSLDGARPPRPEV